MGRILKEPRGHSIQEGLVEYGWEFLRLNFVLSILFATLFFFVVVRHKQDTNWKNWSSFRLALNSGGIWMICGQCLGDTVWMSKRFTVR